MKLLIVPLLLLLLWLGRNRIGGRMNYYVGAVFMAYASLMVYYAWLFLTGRLLPAASVC